ncbi:MAG: hypothetical protein WBQ66_10485 [Blastocatellia bacterium]
MLKTTHRRSSLTRSKQAWVHRLLWGGLCAFLLVTVSAFAGSPAPNPVATSAIVVQEQEPVDETEPARKPTVLVVAITRYGFEPVHATVPAGEYLLMVRNRSGIDGLAIIGHGLAVATPGEVPLKDAPPGPVQDLPIQLGAGKVVTTLVTLVPGVVTFVDPEHPGWTCQFDVTE